MTSRFTATVVAGLLAGSAAAGCCTSTSRANEIVRHLQTLNRVRAEPAMQNAARQLGAKLLPVFPEEVFECDLRDRPSGDSGGDCIEWDERHRRLVTLRDARGTTHEALPIDIHDWHYARLARRGDDWILLVPKLTRRQVDQLKRCDWSAPMPHPGQLVHPRVVFVVEGAPKTDVQQVEVPVTEDYVSYDCESCLRAPL